MEEAKCLNCGSNQNEVPLIAVKTNGKDKWICTQCLPMLIHKREHLGEKLN